MKKILLQIIDVVNALVIVVGFCLFLEAINGRNISQDFIILSFVWVILFILGLFIANLDNG